MLEPAAVIAGYRIDASIDSGNVGETYRATEIALSRPVLLHVVGPPLAQDPGFRDEYLESARKAASLEHPSILPVHESGERDGYLFLSTSYVQGRTLAQILAEDGSLTPTRAAGIVAQIADGLEEAHDAGVTHGHITALSVLIDTRDGHDHAYITGLGVPDPGGATSAEDVSALAVLLEGSVGDSSTEIDELLSGEYPSAAAFGHAARSVAEPVAALRPARRRRWVAGAAALVIVGAVLAIAAAITMSGSSSGSTVAGTVAGEPIAVGTKPFLLTVANSSVWAQTEAGDLVRVDPSRGDVLGLPLKQPGVTEFAFTEDAIVVGRTNGTVVRLDPNSYERIGDVIEVGPNPYAIAVDGNSLWVSTFTDDDPDHPIIEEFDLATGAPRGAPIELPAFVADMIVAEGAVWAGQMFGDAGVLARIDPETHRVVANIAVGRVPSGFAEGGGALWVSNWTVGSVMRIDPATNEVAWTRSVPGVGDIAYGDESVWAMTEKTVLRLDPDSGDTLGEPIALPSPALRIAAGEGGVWVLSHDAGDLTRVQPAEEAPDPAPGQTTKESPPSFPVEGPLTPGRYETEAFEIPLSLEVDDGWTLLDSERANSFSLLVASKPNSGVYFFVVPEVFNPTGTELRPAPKNLARWLRSNPHLLVRRSKVVTIGEHRAVVMDIAVRSTPKPNPPECGPSPCVALFRDRPNSEFFLGPAPGQTPGPDSPAVDRFIFVDVDGKTLTINYGTVGTAEEFEAFVPLAEKLLSTIEFR